MARQMQDEIMAWLATEFRMCRICPMYEQYLGRRNKTEAANKRWRIARAYRTLDLWRKVYLTQIYSKDL